MTTTGGNTPTPPTPPTPPNRRVTRRYATSQDYTRDARYMAAAGWRVHDLTREPGGVIAATYAFDTAAPAGAAAASPAILVSSLVSSAAAEPQRPAPAAG